jgi:flagellar biosynthesis protein
MAAYEKNSKSHSDAAEQPPSKSERPVAVALRDTATAGRPRILASGYDAVAERILEIAFASGIRVREDADLASTLAALEIGREIPLEAFAAVAEILSYVYSANEAAQHGTGPMVSPRHDSETAFGNTP